MVRLKDGSDLFLSHLTRLASPERPRAPVPDLHISLGGSAVVPPGSPLASPGDSQGSSPLVERRPMPLFVPEVEEIRISPVVSRKGYLNVLDDRTNNWIKRWVVSGLVSRFSRHFSWPHPFKAPLKEEIIAIFLMSACIHKE